MKTQRHFYKIYYMELNSFAKNSFSLYLGVVLNLVLTRPPVFVGTAAAVDKASDKIGQCADEHDDECVAELGIVLGKVVGQPLGILVHLFGIQTLKNSV